MAGQGISNAEIAERLDCSVRTVRKWRNRFAEQGTVEALADARRSGRPATVPAAVRCELIKLACDRPEGSKAPFRDVWTIESLSLSLLGQTGWKLSKSEVGRILRAEEIRPHRMRLWLHSPDPDFWNKARAICQIYLHPPEGATVICVDEKTSIQALERVHPTRWPGKNATGKFEFEYERHGTQALIAAFEPQTGKVFGSVGPTRTAEDIVAFMDAVAERYPDGNVYVIWDNLNTHKGERWTEFNLRHGGRFHFVYTPIHASWLNQVEIWFGILSRRILRYGEFRSQADLRERILGFVEHWNTWEAHPFNWTPRGTRRKMGKRKAS